MPPPKANSSPPDTRVTIWLPASLWVAVKQRAVDTQRREQRFVSAQEIVIASLQKTLKTGAATR